jgi:glucokinase
VAAGKPALTIDIGGTKIAVGVVEPGGRLVTAARTPTPRNVDGENLWRTIESLAVAVLAEAGVRGAGTLAGVGCGCAGPIDWPEGRVSPLNIPAWRGFPLRARLGKRFPGVPVRLHNDAVCMAAGEHWRGAGRGTSDMLGVVISTGIGGGLVLDGRLISGATGNAGHVGHVVVEPDGPACACGGNGCVEAIASGPALVSWAQGRGWRSGRKDVSAKDLADDAGRGHQTAQAAMRRGGGALGVAIASVTNLCDLEVVAIGGGLAQAGPLILNPLEEAVRRHARLGYARNVRVVPGSLGQDAGLVGAAALIFGGDRYWPEELLAADSVVADSKRGERFQAGSGR